MTVGSGTPNYRLLAKRPEQCRHDLLEIEYPTAAQDDPPGFTQNPPVLIVITPSHIHSHHFPKINVICRATGFVAHVCL
ncbi:MAG: hypothetical protein K1X42_14205 [Opitutaceae bacterium]|nr:hypothetical protein [Opitutaceae bacterium]